MTKATFKSKRSNAPAYASYADAARQLVVLRSASEQAAQAKADNKEGLRSAEKSLASAVRAENFSEAAQLKVARDKKESATYDLAQAAELANKAYREAYEASQELYFAEQAKTGDTPSTTLYWKKVYDPSTKDSDCVFYFSSDDSIQFSLNGKCHETEAAYIEGIARENNWFVQAGSMLVCATNES